jgi:hypothetical protein
MSDEVRPTAELDFIPTSDVKVVGDLWQCPRGRWHMLHQTCMCSVVNDLTGDRPPWQPPLIWLVVDGEAER